MAKIAKSWWPKALDDAIKSIGSDLGLFHRAPESPAVADQQEFLERLEEVLEFKTPLAARTPAR
jgi:hypothetical protein